MNHFGAVNLVSNAVSSDPARSALNLPFGEAGWIAGSDGHRLHAVRSEDYTQAVRSNAPPLLNIVPQSLEKVGEITLCGEDLECANLIPAAWSSLIWLDEYGARLSCTVHKGGKKNPRKLKMLDAAKVDWLSGFRLTLRKPIALNFRYLLEALEFCGTDSATLWHAPGGADLDPLVFTPGDAARLPLDGERFALVMPCRF